MAIMRGIDEEALKRYLIKRLEPLCEAEPAMLSDYVISLLKNDMPRDELYSMCQKDLQDFLESSTETFVRDLFEQIDNRKFLKNSSSSKAEPSPRSRSNDADTKPRFSNASEGKAKSHTQMPSFMEGLPDLSSDEDDDGAETGSVSGVGSARQAGVQADAAGHKRPRAGSVSSDDEDNGRRSMRKTERSGSPEGNRWKAGRGGDAFAGGRGRSGRGGRDSIYEGVYPRDNAAPHHKMGGGFPGGGWAAGRGGEEYNPDNPVVPELQQRQKVMRGGMPMNPMMLQHAMGGNKFAGGVATQSGFPQPPFPASNPFAAMFPPGMPMPPPGIKTPQELQLFLRTQLQNQIMRKGMRMDPRQMNANNNMNNMLMGFKQPSAPGVAGAAAPRGENPIGQRGDVSMAQRPDAAIPHRGDIAMGQRGDGIPKAPNVALAQRGENMVLAHRGAQAMGIEQRGPTIGMEQRVAAMAMEQRGASMGMDKRGAMGIDQRGAMGMDQRGAMGMDQRGPAMAMGHRVEGMVAAQRWDGQTDKADHKQWRDRGDRAQPSMPPALQANMPPALPLAMPFGNVGASMGVGGKVGEDTLAERMARQKRDERWRRPHDQQQQQQQPQQQQHAHMFEWKNMSDAVIVTNVPESLCVETMLVPYFSKFGHVLGFEPDSSSDEKNNRTARIVFSSHTEAKAAIGCIDAVLGNRFIQVKWGPPTEVRPLQEQPSEFQQRTAKALIPGGPRPGAKTGRVSVSQRLGFVKAEGNGTQGGDLPAEAPMSFDDIVAKQKDLLEQMAHPDMTNAKKAILKQQFAELSLRRAALLKRKQRVLEAGGAAGAADASLGKGAVKGASAAQATTLRLDKRPKALVLSDVHPDLRFAGLLRCHFNSFGKVVDVSQLGQDNSKWLVHFSQRFEAEQALADATLLNGKTLNMSWYTGQQQPAISAEGDQGVKAGEVAKAHLADVLHSAKSGTPDSRQVIVTRKAS